MPSKVSSRERISRVATRSWCTESNSSARTRGSQATMASRCLRRESTTAAAGESSSSSACMCGGRGAVLTESPNAVASFDGEDDLRAPAEIKKLVPWLISVAPSSVPASASASSSSHSRQLVRSPPGSSDQAVTWSSQNSATCPSSPAKAISTRRLSTCATGISSSVRTIERTWAKSSSGTAEGSSRGMRTSLRPPSFGNFKCQPSSAPPVRRRSVILERVRRRSFVS